MTEELEALYITIFTSYGKYYLYGRVFECVEMHDKSHIVTCEFTTAGQLTTKVTYRLMPND